MERTMNSYKWLCLITCLLLLHTPVFAQTTIFTESFEDPVSTNTTPLPTPTGWTYVSRADFNGNYATTTPYGSQVLRAYNAWVLQTTAVGLSETIQIGSEYTVSLNYGSWISDRDGNFRVNILAIDESDNATVLASDFREWFTDNDYSAASESFSLSVIPSSNAGERLAIEIREYVSGSKMHLTIDNIVLSKVPPPPPAGTVITIK